MVLTILLLFFKRLLSFGCCGNQMSPLWDNKGKLILILILVYDSAGPGVPVPESLFEQIVFGKEKHSKFCKITERDAKLQYRDFFKSSHEENQHDYKEVQKNYKETQNKYKQKQNNNKEPKTQKGPERLQREASCWQGNRIKRVRATPDDHNNTTLNSHRRTKRRHKETRTTTKRFKMSTTISLGAEVWLTCLWKGLHWLIIHLYNQQIRNTTSVPG